uniref:Uncharacterized protein n=1 Tax=Caudovirales sp. ctrNG92 TaxID=2827638 RepID=A0A8S5SDT9_9CAUD|nr:MAG TPA: hypothetical protein [Caudovirales sp. ctrNG92]
MEKMTNAELAEALRRRAGMSGSYGYNAGETLRAAADRIEQLEREKHDILHLWYKCREMCEICAHKCTNVEAESCGECEQECLCLVCEGENWEEEMDDG